MNAPSKIKAQEQRFKLRSTLARPVHCFAVRLEALLRVRPFISTEPMRYYLNGVFVHSHADGGAVCAATDGCRLGVRRDKDALVNEPQIVRLPKELKTPTAKSWGGAWAVATRTGDAYGHLSLIERIHDPEHDTAENAIARVEDCYQRFGDVLIDGTFPDYTRVLPPEQKGDIIRSFNGSLLGSFGSLTIRGGDAKAPHVVLDSDDSDFVGVLMPRMSSVEKRQDWARSLSYPGA